MHNFERNLCPSVACDEEEFEFNASDEEITSDWEPEPEEIVEMFEAIDRNETLELEWQTPMKMPLSPEINNGIGNLEDMLMCNENTEATVGMTGFDFEETTSPMKIALRPIGTDASLRGSAKRKSANLKDILSSMAKHQQLDMMEDEDGSINQVDSNKDSGITS